MINNEKISGIAEQYDSFYLYDENEMLDRMSRLKEAIPDAEFLYSVKCNPDRNVLKTVFSNGFGADAASAREVESSFSLGLPKDKIFYSAPGKTIKDIEKSLGKAVIIADSLSEMRKLREAAKASGRKLKIGIRVNPDFSMDGNQGTASKFGIDESDAVQYLRQVKDPDVDVAGIHVHLRSQILDAQKLVMYYRRMFSLAERIEAAQGKKLEFINLGSGIGIPYSAEDRELDLKMLGKQAEAEIRRYKETHPETRVLIETGRYIMGKSGIFVTHVADRKVSHGRTYIILSSTLNGFIRPSLAKLVEKYAQDSHPAGTEPLFTETGECGFRPIPVRPEKEKVTIAGNLCTAADVIAENAVMPQLLPGDILVMTNAGSYGAALSPFQFSSQPVPAELFLTKEGRILVNGER